MVYYTVASIILSIIGWYLGMIGKNCILTGVECSSTQHMDASPHYIGYGIQNPIMNFLKFYLKILSHLTRSITSSANLNKTKLLLYINLHSMATVFIYHEVCDEENCGIC